MAVIFIIVAVVGIVILLFLFIKHLIFKHYLINGFKDGNTIVFGKKRRGKDLVFQFIINARDDFYYSNISYGGKKKIITLKDVSIEPNTYRNFINNNITRIDRKFYEGKDIYISDVGNFLPSQYDSLLHKEFPSMPLLYSLSGHLYANNIHCNSQSLERPWKALREQADFFVKCKHTIKHFPFFFIVKVNTYEKYESAKLELEPLNARILNKYSKAEVDLYKARHGDIRSGHVFIRKSKVKYDTRAFEKLIFKKGSRRKIKKV